MHKLPILGLALLLAGCAGLKPDYTKPAVDLPAGWRDAPADGVQARDARWWKVYGDPSAGASRQPDRKSTRLNSSHRCISYAVFCLKKKKQRNERHCAHDSATTRQ